MRQHTQELSDYGVGVCVVTFEAGPLAMAYVRETNLEWPLLVDTDRTLYKAYGMEQGTWWDIFGPASMATYLKLLLRGRRLHRSEGDLQQLGGDVLIDPKGIVQIHHVGSGPADRPSVSTLLAPLRPA